MVVGGQGEAFLYGRVRPECVVQRVPLGGSARERLDRGLNLIQLYGVYTEVDCIFDTRNVQALWEKTPAAERKTFPFDPAGYDWSHYFQKVHFPTVVRMSRAERNPC